MTTKQQTQRSQTTQTSNSRITIFIPFFNSDPVPYFDEKGVTYAFRTEKEAKAFAEKNNLRYKRQCWTKDAMYTNCYRYGTKIIRTSRDNIIARKNIENEYFNQDTNASILKLKETKKESLIRRLFKGKFLVPILFEKEIRYAALTYDDKMFFLCFTTLANFESFGKMPEGYTPVEIDGANMFDICKGSGLIINPGTVPCLILTAEQLTKVEEEQK